MTVLLVCLCVRYAGGVRAVARPDASDCKIGGTARSSVSPQRREKREAQATPAQVSRSCSLCPAVS
eukprot:4858576-Amphidinium_carterae.1